MKACFISGSYPPILCGIGDYVQRLAASLAEQGTGVEVLTSEDEISPGCDGAVAIWPVVRHWDVRALPLILSQLRAIAPNVVNIQYPTQRYGRQPLINLLPILIRVALHIPVVTTVHEFSTYHRLGRLRVGLSVLTSNQVIAPDRGNVTQMGRAFPIFRSKLHYIPLGANIEPDLSPDFDRCHQRSTYGASQFDVVIAYFGFISPSKGIETLLRAFKRILLEHPNYNMRLLLIANREPVEPLYAPYHRHIESTLGEVELGNRIHWTGHLPSSEVSAYLASADIAVLPFRDGASLRRTTLLSALAHGLPVISSLGASTTDDGLSGDQGLCLVPVGDEQALAKAILTLAKDSGLRDTLAARARQFVSTFSWANIAVWTLAVYHVALKG